MFFSVYDSSEIGQKMSAAHINVYKHSEEQDLGNFQKYIWLLL